MLAECTGPSPGATPPGSGPPCGNLSRTVREAMRADHGSWHSLCVDVTRSLAGRTALPAVGCTDAVLREGQKPTAPRSSGAWGWAKERARAARRGRRGLGHRSSAEGASPLGNTIFFPGLGRGVEARSRGALQHQLVGSRVRGKSLGVPGPGPEPWLFSRGPSGGVASPNSSAPRAPRPAPPWSRLPLRPGAPRTNGGGDGRTEFPRAGAPASPQRGSAFLFTE